MHLKDIVAVGYVMFGTMFIVLKFLLDNMFLPTNYCFTTFIHQFDFAWLVIHGTAA